MWTKHKLTVLYKNKKVQVKIRTSVFKTSITNNKLFSIKAETWQFLNLQETTCIKVCIKKLNRQLIKVWYYKMMAKVCKIYKWDITAWTIKLRKILRRNTRHKEAKTNTFLTTNRKCKMINIMCIWIKISMRLMNKFTTKLLMGQLLTLQRIW